MEAFSDGVFAVAITLLVLEISVPQGSQATLLRALLDQWPSYLAYVVSFATVGAVWLGRSAMTNFFDHVDELFLRLNLLLLLLVAFLPFPTRLLAESVADDTAGRVASPSTASLFWRSYHCSRCCGSMRAARASCRSATPGTSSPSSPVDRPRVWPSMGR